MHRGGGTREHGAVHGLGLRAGAVAVQLLLVGLIRENVRRSAARRFDDSGRGTTDGGHAAEEVGGSHVE